MRIRWTFDDCDQLIQHEIKEYWNKKTTRLERLLVTFPEDLSVSIYRSRSRGVFEGRAILQLPSRTLAAGAAEPDPWKLVDRLADVLATEIRRYRARSRLEGTSRRRDRRRDELVAAGPLLAQDRDERRREAFFELLLPILWPLKEHARRELRLLEHQGKLGHGEVIAGDIISEVVLRAWEEFDDRPSAWSLDVWLMDLMDDCLNRLRSGPQRSPLTRKILASVAQRQQREQQMVSTLTMDELLPGDEGSQGWEDLGDAEQQNHLDRLLAAMPAHRRNAFFQFVLEGFDAAEIAMIQDRPEDEVKADIEKAREALRELLQLQGRDRQAPTTDPTASPSPETSAHAMEVAAAN